MMVFVMVGSWFQNQNREPPVSLRNAESCPRQNKQNECERKGKANGKETEVVVDGSGDGKRGASVKGKWG